MILGYFLVLFCFNSLQAQRLSSYNVNVSSISVSGFSGGAYFATQFHVAFSSYISGLGTWSGGPNLCLLDAHCTSNPSLINIPDLVTQTEILSFNEDIDPISNIANDR